MYTDDELKDLEKRLTGGKVSIGAMKKLLPELVSVLRARTQRLTVLNHFVREIGDDDALYTPATDVWRRKDAGKFSVEWVRANAPLKFQEPPQ